MTIRQNLSLGIVLIPGLLAMLMPLSIDMYLPALTTAWPMLISMAICAIGSVLFYFYASRSRKTSR